MTDGSLPLTGMRVLDLGIAWAGAYAGRLLGDLGADVIKIETRKRLDLRGPVKPPPGVGAYPDGDPGEEPWNRAGIFHERHRNKRSLTLELDLPGGRETFLALARQCHAVTENFSPRVMKHLGIDYDSLRAVNPAIVMISMSGFGQTGPQRDYVAFGDTLEQVSGSVSLGGYPDGPPMNSGLHYPDPVVGTLAAGMVISALRRARATGQGTFIDLAQVEVVRWMLSHQLISRQFRSEVATQRRGNRHAWHAPQGCFPCRGDDRWVALTVQTDAQWAALATAIAAPDLAVQFPTAHDRRAHQTELEQRIGTWTSDRSPDEVVSVLRSAGVPVGEVLEVEALLANEQLLARQCFDLHPVDGGRPRTVLGGVWRFDDRRLGLRFRAPKLGEHNEQILREVAGLSEAEIARLAAGGVIGTLPRELEQD